MKFILKTYLGMFSCMQGKEMSIECNRSVTEQLPIQSDHKVTFLRPLWK